MDGSRRRRRKDRARRAWYAHHRQLRFARWLGFLPADRGAGDVDVARGRGLLMDCAGGQELFIS